LSIGGELVKPKSELRYVEQVKKLMGYVSIDDDEEKKKNFDVIINVLTKIHFIFGQKPFIDRSNNDPFLLYVNQNWFQQLNNDQHQHDINSLINGWTSIISQWLKLSYQNRQYYIQQIPHDQFHNDDH